MAAETAPTPPVAAAGASAKPLPRCFHVYLKRPNGVASATSAPLGLRYDVLLDRLVIREVLQGGLLSAYNAEVRLLPLPLADRQLQSGDTIVCINGHVDLDDMRAALRSAPGLHLFLERTTEISLPDYKR